MFLRRLFIIFVLFIIHYKLNGQTKDSVLSTTDTLMPNNKNLTVDTLNRNDTAQKIQIRKRADYIITGKILDTNTSEGLPFSTIFFPHTAIGTAADIDGNFIIHIENLPKDTLRIEALGYMPIIKKLQKTQHEYKFIVELHRSETTLTEFTIRAKGVDPALLLVKRIIAAKPKNNPDKTDNYKYEAYNRLEIDMKNISKKNIDKKPIINKYSFVFNNIDTVTESEPFLPVYLTETISDYYFRKNPKKEREIIKGSMVKGVNNDEVVKYLGTAYQNINIYDNSIPVFDKKFISPISNEGPFFYKYAIKDTQKAFGHNIILVQFHPRRNGELCFSGDFWVVDSVYAIERVSLVVPNTVNMNWADKISLYQEFAQIDSVWFCTKDKFIASVSAYKSKKIPGFIARKTTTYHNIVINDSMLGLTIDNPDWKDRVIKKDSVTKKDDVWWNNNRPDTLTKTEKSIHKMVDTILAMPITKHYINVITFLTSGVKDVGPIELGPYWYLYSNNLHEGDRVRLTLGTPRTLNNLHIAGYVAYGFKDNRFKYGLEEKWIINRKPWTYLYSTFSADLSQGIDNFDHVRSDNMFSNLVRKPGIPWKQAFIEKERIELYKLYYSGFSHTFILQHRNYTPYAPLPSYSIFTDINGQPSKNVISSEVGVDFRYAYKEKYLDGKYKRIKAGTKYPIIDFIITSGFKNVLNSSYNYQKANISLKESVNIPPYGHISYNVFAGKYFGKLPYPLLEVHPGNEYMYYDKYSFEMMNAYEFISDEFFGVNFEHDIGGGIFNHIPLLKKMKLRQFWTAKSMIGTLSDENRTLNLNSGYPFRTLDGIPYLELGTGVSNIFNIIRFDFVWRVMPTPSTNESKERYFGIFVSLKLEF